MATSKHHRTPPTFGLSPSHSGLSSGSKAHFSAWTPVNHMPSNEQLYQERMALIGHWYDMWSHTQRQEFLKFVLERSTSKQQRYAHNLLDPKLPALRQDFTTVLPRHLILHIFSFLDARSMCRACSVSWYWHFLAEQDSLWQPKCIQFGWYLPYTPGDKEYGAWKRHYVACLNTLDRGAPNKQIALLYSTLGGLPPPNDSQTTSPQKRKSSRKQYGDGEPSLNSSPFLPSTLARLGRPPWLDPDPKPRDLEHGWKAMKSAGSVPPSVTGGMHHSTFSATSKALSLASASTLAGSGRREARNHGDEEENEASSLSGERDPAQSTLVKLSELIKDQTSRLGTNVYESVALSNTWPKYNPQAASGMGPTRTYSDRYVNDMRPPVMRYPSHSHPSVILISSKVPAPELLLEGLVFGVLPLIYDYASSSVESLVERLDYLLAGRQARSIGLFMEASDGELLLVEGESANYQNIETDGSQRFFWEALCCRCIPSLEGGRLDLFTTLASNAQGMELLNSLHRFTGYQISAARSLANKRELVDSDWVIVNDTSRSPMSPPALYFNLKSLATWTSTCLYIENACATVRTMLESYLRSQRKDLVTRTVGRVVMEALSLHQISSVSRRTSKLLVNAVVDISQGQISSKDEIVTALASYFRHAQRQGFEHAHGASGASGGSNSSPPLVRRDSGEVSLSPQLLAKSNRRPPSSTSTPVTRRKKDSTTGDHGDKDGGGDDTVGDGGESTESELDPSPVPPAFPESPAVSPQLQNQVQDATSVGSRSKLDFSFSSAALRHTPTALRHSPTALRHSAAPVSLGESFTLEQTAAPRIISVALGDGIEDWMGQRHSVAMEIGRTEKVYRRCLRAIRESFHVPLKNAISIGKAIVSSTNLELIFTDMEVLLEIAKKTDLHMQAKLNDWTAYQRLGDVFESFTSSLQSYVNFASNYPTALATIMRCQADSPAFRAFLKQQAGQPATAMLDLFELFLLPAQRIVSYIHLLSTFKVVTPPDHPDHKLLDLSIARLERMKAMMQEEKERAMRERRLANLQEMIVGCPILHEGHRYLLYETTFNQLVHCHYGRPYQQGESNDGPIFQHVRDVGVFLFTDAMLLTAITVHHFPFERATSTKHNYAACFALDSVRVIDMLDSKYIRHTFALATPDDTDRWTLRAPSQDAKLSFIAALRKAVDSIRPIHYD